MQKVDNLIKSKGVAGLGDRLQAAAAAKKAQLEKWRLNVVDVNDPAYLEQQAALQAAAAAREERTAQRKAEKDAAKEREVAERKAAQEAIEAQARAAQAEREAAAVAAAAAAAELEVQRKAIRDARYAARKARK